MNIYQLPRPLDGLAALFDGHRDLRAVIDGACQGKLGRIFVDDPGNVQAARLSAGVYEVFGGDPAHGQALMNSVPRPCELVIPPAQQGWKDLLDTTYAAHATVRSMRTFDASRIDPSVLLRHTRACPPGYVLQTLTLEITQRIGSVLGPNRISNFGDAATFMERGFGCCALAGDQVACAATTYAVSNAAAEIAIATDPAHRRRGLGVVVGAQMVRMCLERGLEPIWTAANEISTRVALALGYRQVDWCQLYDLTPGNDA